MYKILSLLFLLFSKIVTGQIQQKNDFTIIGKVNYKTERYIYFVWYNADEERFLDSAFVSKGRFIFKGQSNGYLNRFYVKSNPSNRDNNDSIDNVNIPIDNSKMYLELKIGQFSKYNLVGCKSCNEIKKKDIKYLPYYKKSEKYQEKINDSLTSKSLRKKFSDLDSANMGELKNNILTFCISNLSSNLTPYYLYEWSDVIKEKTLSDLYNGISQFQKNSFNGIKVKEIIDDNFFRNHQIGTKAFDFERVGFDSTLITFKMINENNYILLDFWASWCVPCRASHPQLIKLYEKYKFNNFKIIGIADDDNVQKWKSAIKMDSIFIWSQTLKANNEDTKKNNDDLLNKYYIEYLPTKILIAPNGLIIARFVGEEGLMKLENKLKEIYKY